MSISELDRQAAAYFELQQQIADLEAEAEAIRDVMRSAMVDRGEEEITGNGWKCTWHNTCIRKFDSKAFKAEHGELYQSFCRPVSGVRFTMSRITA